MLHTHVRGLLSYTDGSVDMQLERSIKLVLQGRKKPSRDLKALNYWIKRMIEFNFKLTVLAPGVTVYTS